MSLLYDMMEDVRLLDKRSVPDGSGGFTYEWTDGASFKAAIVKNQTLAARVAEKQGVTEVYTITAPSSVDLDFHDVVKRISDGATFRVTSTSTDSKSPDMATFRICSVSAERWDIPK